MITDQSSARKDSASRPARPFSITKARQYTIYLLTCTYRRREPGNVIRHHYSILLTVKDFGYI